MSFNVLLHHQFLLLHSIVCIDVHNLCNCFYAEILDYSLCFTLKSLTAVNLLAAFFIPMYDSLGLIPRRRLVGLKSGLQL